MVACYVAKRRPLVGKYCKRKRQNKRLRKQHRQRRYSTLANKGNIVIDPSVIKERSNTYSSLTDINGADVFTNSYKARVEKMEKEQKETDKEFGDAVFVKAPNEEIDIEQQVKEQIFTGTTTQVQKEMVINDTSGNELIIPIAGIIFVVIFVIAIWYIDKRKKERGKYDVDNYNYES